MSEGEVHVQWRVSRHDVRHGLPRDAAPHLVTALVAGAWAGAPWWGGTSAFTPLGAAVLVVQLLMLGRVAARRHRDWRSSERVLTVRGSSFVLTDRHGTTSYDTPIVGVEDDRGVLRLEFADGSVLEAPWRAFTHRALRRLRHHLRVRLGEEADLHHVPVRRVGQLTGAAAWRRPVMAVVVAAVLALLPWLVPPAAPAGPFPGSGAPALRAAGAVSGGA